MMIIIPGIPQAWTAPRVTRNGHTFSPKYQLKLDAQCHVRNQYHSSPVKPVDYAVSIEIVFSMPIPKSTTKKMLKSILDGDVPHTKKPDIDNMCKYAIDVIKGIVILDDNQVCELRARKEYSLEPRTLMTIIPMVKKCLSSQVSLRK